MIVNLIKTHFFRCPYCCHLSVTEMFYERRFIFTNMDSFVCACSWYIHRVYLVLKFTNQTFLYVNVFLHYKTPQTLIWHAFSLVQKLISLINVHTFKAVQYYIQIEVIWLWLFELVYRKYKAICITPTQSVPCW